jgi:DMSO/TMAO reductase YedYZ molybdopterin-dependent catalytic subunit
MSLTRRDAIVVSGSALAGLSIGALKGEGLAAQAAGAGAAAQAQEWPTDLVERPRRTGFPAPLPLNADGSAPEHPESAAGPITDPLMWRTQGRVTPQIEYDYTKMAIRVDTRGLGTKRGTMHFSDLSALPRVSHTFLLQCGTPTPKGIVKWTGVRFSDFANMLGLVPGAHYCRISSVDGHYTDESVTELSHPQVMLAWMMNDAALPADHGAPLRLIVPFRYGNRSVKSVNEIIFGTPSLPRPTAG